MRYVLPILILTSLFGLSCGDPTTSHYCSYNSDCPDAGPSYCVLGICRYDQCQDTQDCPDSQLCVEGLCSDG